MNVEVGEARLTGLTRVTCHALTAHWFVVETMIEAHASVAAGIGRRLLRNSVTEAAAIFAALAVTVATLLLGRNQSRERLGVFGRARVTGHAGHVAAEVVAVRKLDLVSQRATVAGAPGEDHDGGSQEERAVHSASSGRYEKLS
jgi:hypothetical protein